LPREAVANLLGGWAMRFLAVAAVLAASSAARADELRDPAFTIRALAFAGGGMTRLTAGHYAAASFALGLDAAYWFEPGVAVGVRLVHGVYAPFNPGTTDAELAHWNEAIEPELVLRRVVRRFPGGGFAVGGSASAGVNDVRTMDVSAIHGHEEHVTGHAREIAHAYALSGSVAGGFALRIRWVELAAGVLAEANRAGDWAVGPYATLGATF
jgi:hypothetical protein